MFFRSFSEEVRSLIPVEEAQVWIGINTVYHAVQQSIKLLSLTHDEWKSDVAPNQGDISDKLAVLGSMISAVNTSVVVTRLTLLIRKV